MLVWVKTRTRTRFGHREYVSGHFRFRFAKVLT